MSTKDRVDESDSGEVGDLMMKVNLIGDFLDDATGERERFLLLTRQRRDANNRRQAFPLPSLRKAVP